MSSIPFPIGSFPGRRTHESAGRLINCYAEPLGPGAVAPAKLVSSAGLLPFSQPNVTPPTLSPLEGYRGSILVGGLLYAAFKDMLVTINSSGVVSRVDTDTNNLAGVDRVQFSRNNRVPAPGDPGGTTYPDIVVTTQTASYLVGPGGLQTEINPPDMVEITNVFMDGYTFYGAANGRIQASDINKAAVFDALDFTATQAKAGQLRRLINYDQHLFAFCETWIEVYRNVANPVGFPFNRVAVINRGLIARYAVTGYQDGFGKMLAWVGDDNAVHVLSGYEATRISTPDVDRDIEAVADKSTIEMQCYIAAGGAPFVVVSCPEFTWEFNLATQNWNERLSRLRNGTQFKRWRATGDVTFAFNRWLTGDTQSGRLFEITTDTRREDDAPLVSCIESAPVHDFPKGLSVPRADFNFSPGTGRAPGLDPIETNPKIAISWSDDGGLHWSNPLWRDIGRQDTNPEITVLRTGRTSAQGRRWRLEIGDPCYISLLGGDMQVEQQTGQASRK